MILQKLVYLPRIERRIGFDQGERDRAGSTLDHLGIHCLTAHHDALLEDHLEVQDLLVELHGGRELPSFETDGEVVYLAQAAVEPGTLLRNRRETRKYPRIATGGALHEGVNHISEASDRGRYEPVPLGRFRHRCGAPAHRLGECLRGVGGRKRDIGHPVTVLLDVCGCRVVGTLRHRQHQPDLILAERHRTDDLGRLCRFGSSVDLEPIAVYELRCSHRRVLYIKLDMVNGEFIENGHVRIHHLLHLLG